MVSLKKILNKILVDSKNTFKKSDIIPVGNGGTGSKSAEAACLNLGIKDYVVDQGTIGIYPAPVTGPQPIWTYRKWNSGMAECFGYIFLGSIPVSAVGKVYRGNTSVPLPDIFNDIPSNVHTTIGEPLVHIISINGRATDANTIGVYVWKATGSTVDISASFHVIGTWK